MNKVFKVVFNKSLGTCVAVSEIAKSKGKTKSETTGTSADSQNNAVGYRSFLLKATTVAVLSAFGSQAYAWTVTKGAENGSDTVTVAKGDTEVKIDAYTAAKPNVVAGEMNRGGNPARIVWYGNPSDSDGDTAQTKATNDGYI